MVVAARRVFRALLCIGVLSSGVTAASCPATADTPPQVIFDQSHEQVNLSHQSLSHIPSVAPLWYTTAPVALTPSVALSRQSLSYTSRMTIPSVPLCTTPHHQPLLSASQPHQPLRTVHRTIYHSKHHQDPSNDTAHTTGDFSVRRFIRWVRKGHSAAPISRDLSLSELAPAPAAVEQH